LEPSQGEGDLTQPSDDRDDFPKEGVIGLSSVETGIGGGQLMRRSRETQTLRCRIWCCMGRAQSAFWGGRGKNIGGVKEFVKKLNLS
jgi:hypothetical protein